MRHHICSTWRETPITFDSLHDKLKAVKNQIVKDSKIWVLQNCLSPRVPTANYTSRNNRFSKQNHQMGTPGSHGSNWRPQSSHRQNFTRSNSSFNPRPQNPIDAKKPYCQYCIRQSHLTKEYFQLAHLLRENGMQPTTNFTSVNGKNIQPWLFDTDASHIWHLTWTISHHLTSMEGKMKLP